MENDNRKKRVKNILRKLMNGLYEREEVMSVSLLSALAGQNIFLLGPPGTAKSLIARRLASVFKTDSYYEHLMQKFTTPEEVFGPLSISELKKDNYIRKTNGYLPEAEFAFLDEIWKSSSAILNTLLTIINEKKFKNGNENKSVPLKILISASNETPAEGEGLEALYDRFLTRILVNPINLRGNFDKILQNGATNHEVKIGDELAVTDEELNKWACDINKVLLSDETLNVIAAIRIEIDKYNQTEKNNIYISDRRWQKAAFLLKASAFFTERAETNLLDCVLLKYCLWSNLDDVEVINNIVNETITVCGLYTNSPASAIDKSISEIEQTLSPKQEDKAVNFKTVTINGNKYLKHNVSLTPSNSINSTAGGGLFGGIIGQAIATSNSHQQPMNIDIYISVDKVGTTTSFNPVDNNEQPIQWIEGKFNKDHFELEVNLFKLPSNSNIFGLLNGMKTGSSNQNIKIDPFYPEKNKSSNKKNVLSNDHKKALETFLSELEDQIKENASLLTERASNISDEFDNPFISKSEIAFVKRAIKQQSEDYKFRLKSCERLRSILNK
jgi:MoxR-like ATPase